MFLSQGRPPCPQCMLRAAASWLWAGQQVRRASQLRQRDGRPSRMTLSPTVATGPTAGRAGREDRSAPLAAHGPFAGMNKTVAPADLKQQRERLVKEKTQRLNRERAKKKGEGEMKTLRMHRALKSISYMARGKVKSRIEGLDSFKVFDLLPVVQEALATEGLKGLEDLTPTPIQRLAIPAMLAHRQGKTKIIGKFEQFLLAAETGSGKTLAYLLPVLDAVKRLDIVEREERQRAEAAAEAAKGKRVRGLWELESPPLSNGEDPDTARPKAIVLLPTAELVDQVGALFKAFSHVLKLRVSSVSSFVTAPIIRRRLFTKNGIDILISTPHLLDSVAMSEPNILSRVTHLVADEADSLFDRSFMPLTSAIIDRASPSLKQLVLCSATIPRSLDGFLDRRFPNIKRLTTPNLHAIPRRVQLSVVDIEKTPYQGNRDLACADTLWNLGRDAAGTEGMADADPDNIKRVIVFVNEREAAVELADYLVSKGVDAVALNRDTTAGRREEILAVFTSRAVQSRHADQAAAQAVQQAQREAEAEAGAPEQEDEQVPQDLVPAPGPDAHRKLPNVKVIVMTDIGSRGIDTVHVRHVILYDVPHTTVDFIHRLGRVGRMGRRGRATVLVGRKDRRDVVREVREGMFRGQALL